jgi:hypothetical protein
MIRERGGRRKKISPSRDAGPKQNSERIKLLDLSVHKVINEGSAPLPTSASSKRSKSSNTMAAGYEAMPPPPPLEDDAVAVPSSCTRKHQDLRSPMLVKYFIATCSRSASSTEGIVAVA